MNKVTSNIKQYKPLHQARKLQPHDLAVRAAFERQLKTLQNRGFDPEHFLVILRIHPELSVAEIGNLRATSVEVLCELLGSIAKSRGTSRIVATEDDDGPTTAREILAMLGRGVA